MKARALEHLQHSESKNARVSGAGIVTIAGADGSLRGGVVDECFFFASCKLCTVLPFTPHHTHISVVLTFLEACQHF